MKKTEKDLSPIVERLRNSAREVLPIILSLVMVILLVASFIVGLEGTRLYYIGSHNEDLGHNMRFLESQYDTKFYDFGSDYKERSAEEMVSLGSNQKEIGLQQMIGASICFGFLVCFYYFVTSTFLMIDLNKEWKKQDAKKKKEKK